MPDPWVMAPPLVRLDEQGVLQGRGSLGNPMPTASCLCCAVTLPTSGAPFRSGLCNWLDCRKHSGSLFGAYAIFPTEAVSIAGETCSYLGRHYCPTCGSAVFFAWAMSSQSSLSACRNAGHLLPPTYPPPPNPWHTPPTLPVRGADGVSRWGFGHGRGRLSMGAGGGS